MKRDRWRILGAVLLAGLFVGLVGCCGFFAEIVIAVWPSYDEAKSEYAVAHADQLVAEAAKLIETAKQSGDYDFDVHQHLPPAIAAMQPLRLSVEREQDAMALLIQTQAGFSHQGFFVIVDPGTSDAEFKHGKFKSRKLCERIIEYRGGG